VSDKPDTTGPEELQGWTEDFTALPGWQIESVAEMKRQFVASYKAAAQSEQVRSQVPVLVTLGQAALESGWGVHAPRFNFFGIKAKLSDPEPTRQLLRTREILHDATHHFPEIISITKQPDGRYLYIIRDWFRAFPDAAAAFSAHGDFLVNNSRYDPAFAFTSEPYRFAEKLALAGYATDPHYDTKLPDTMRSIESLISTGT
jgi:flagellum-specific peptidoglycan hydrolase FlgJ